MASSTSKLFEPTRLGKLDLSHRIVLAPTTRFRAGENHVPLPHVQEYYEQRASTPGTLLITEATFIAPRAGGYPNVPGIWSEEQIAAWKTIVDRVHAKGSFIYLQLWAIGRQATPAVLDAEGLPFVSASDIPKADTPTEIPRALTTDEIKEYVELYAIAASNAVHKAGFDGVEIHSANGYLLNQFLNPRSNVRTDQYGGSVEKRGRFVLEVAEAVTKAVGEERTGIRFSPWGTYGDMYFPDPKPEHSYVTRELLSRYPNFAYLHVVEPSTDGDHTVDTISDGASNDFLREIWGDKPFISAGEYTRDAAMTVADTKGDLVAFSRAYIANPDLPYRLQHDIPLQRGDRKLYYVYGSTDPQGYTDYPFAQPVLVN